jgi:hypothetical protein
MANYTYDNIVHQETFRCWLRYGNLPWFVDRRGSLMVVRYHIRLAMLPSRLLDFTHIHVHLRRNLPTINLRASLKTELQKGDGV